MSPKRFANIWYDGDHNRERLRCQREVLGSDVLEAGGAHRTSAEYDLTRPGVEGFEELDDTRHRVRREKAEVHDHFNIIGKEDERILSRRNGEVASLLDAKMFPGLRGRDSVCSRARARRGCSRRGRPAIRPGWL